MNDTQKFFLCGECPLGARVRFQLAGERITVARHGDISLSDPSVSREHAVLTWNGDVWRVTDVGSRNGTYVNGVSVQRKLIAPGDVVKFGRVALNLVDEEHLDDDAETATCVMTMTGAEATTFSPRGPGAQALVGRSEALKSAMRLAARAAKSKATVLLFGESGTGKELFAKMVWEESDRAKKKFLPVHSGAIEQSLLASALFGHEKGAFTGADKQKAGLFEEADGGTIFLDEIGEINFETQVKLLRVLQEGEFMRVGGTEPIKVDVRVICATNRDLAAAVKEGKFREDLYYRLNVIQIPLPPLRERVGDIEDLVNHFVKQLGGPLRTVSPAAMAALCAYRWPGNIRELRNMVERMVILSEHNELGVDDLPPEIAAARSVSTAALGSETPVSSVSALPVMQRPISLEDWERQAIHEALEKSGGNKVRAAQLLNLSRSALYEKLKKYGLG